MQIIGFIPFFRLYLRPSGQARRGGIFRTPPGSRESNGKEVLPGAAGILLGYFYACSGTIFPYNTFMRRWLPFLIALAIGLGLGLYYGWVISPLEYVDTSPETLKTDYRADYVLMVAETYASKQDPALAARQLAIFGSRSPADLAAEALASAADLGYLPADQTKLQNLMLALQAWDKTSGAAQP